MPDIRGDSLPYKGTLSVDGTVIGHIQSWKVNRNNVAFLVTKCPVCGSPRVYEEFPDQGSVCIELLCTNRDCKTRKGPSRYDIAKGKAGK